ncbi:MAG: PH domain-containing protein [Bacteroidales bacterium]|nr:PH domain-containing protein [Bacteroidales bacterium]
MIYENMGSYANNHLIRNESVVFETKLHWITIFTLRSVFTLTIAFWFDRWLSEFVITNRRIIIKTGFIARETLEMNLTKIESVNVDQSILGRILNYGSITIIGTGGTTEVFDNISKPLEFRKAFQEEC